MITKYEFTQDELKEAYKKWETDVRLHPDDWSDFDAKNKMDIDGLAEELSGLLIKYLQK